jgi:hypothetical protein
LPSVLFLPDLHYDHRIWADIPASLDERCDIVHYDTHEPMRWTAPETFLTAVRRLVPDDASTVAVAAGYAAGFAIQAALSGLAGGLVLFQPAPDYIPPEAMSDVPVEELIRVAEPYAGLVDASRETDPARRAELVTGALRDIYTGNLAASDLALVCQVIGEHAEELLATVTEATTAAEAAASPPRPGLPWVGLLDEVTVPVTVVTSRRASAIGEALAKRILAGQFEGADAYTDLPWLEDRAVATTVLHDMLARLR